MKGLINSKRPQNSSLQLGFTLIELIAVLVILGILTVTAIPRMINLQEGALINTTKHLKTQVTSAANLIFAQAAINGVHTLASTTIDINGTSVDISYGYPTGTATGISRVVNYPSGDWNSRASIFSGAWVYWHGHLTEDAGTGQCYIRYRQPTTAGGTPVIDEQYSGC